MICFYKKPVFINRVLANWQQKFSLIIITNRYFRLGGWDNIIIDPINFGFAGNGHEDIGVAKHITKLAAAVIVLDCLPNMNPATVKAKTVPIVKYLRANGHATTPIVMAEIPPLLSEANWYLLR